MASFHLKLNAARAKLLGLQTVQHIEAALTTTLYAAPICKCAKAGDKGHLISLLSSAVVDWSQKCMQRLEWLFCSNASTDSGTHISNY